MAILAEVIIHDTANEIHLWFMYEIPTMSITPVPVKLGSYFILYSKAMLTYVT